MRTREQLVEFEAEVREVFFAAMLAGYAADAPKVGVTELPRAKMVVFARGDYVVNDFYFTAEGSRYSSGMTVIRHKGQPVWTLQYQGWYELKAIPFLKRALRCTYEQSIFRGGRGPKMFRQGAYSYQNHVEEFRETFRHFVGREQVSRYEEGEGLKVAGWHEYQGMLYLPFAA